MEVRHLAPDRVDTELDELAELAEDDVADDGLDEGDNLEMRGGEES